MSRRLEVLELDKPPAADDPFSTIALIIVCLILSFLFAGSETAITSMGETRVRRLLDEGRGPKRFLETWIEDHTSILTSLLAGNTLVNIVASALTTSLMLSLGNAGAVAQEWTDWVTTAGVFTLSMLVLVIGEIAPKTLAKNNPTWFLRPFWMIWVFHLCTTRLTSGLSWIAKRMLKVLGVDPDAGGFAVTEEQIEDMVRLGSEEGSIDTSRGDLLQNVFDLWDTSVYHIMTPRTQVVGLDGDLTYDEVVAKVRETGLSRYPIFGETTDEILGLFYAKTLLSGEMGPEDFDLREYATEAMFVPESQKAGALLREFQTRAVHIAVVVDEHGGTAGVVSLEDVLEEPVGEIYDEHDEVEALVEAAGPDRWIVDGSADLRTVEERLDIEFPDETPYSTISGFVTDQVGKLPEVSEEFSWQNLNFTVLEADDKRVIRVALQRLAEPLAEAN